MARESSIELILQNAMIAYEYFHQPIYEMYYQDHSYPTAVWSGLLVLRLISVLSSAYGRVAREPVNIFILF